jgi:5'-3' exonuclease
VQIIRKGMQIRNAEGVRAKFGVPPELVADYLALVGDAQDGYPGIRGIGASTAASLLNKYGPIESFPDTVLGDNRDNALLFKNLATLRVDAPLFKDVDELEWKGATSKFAEWPQKMDDKRIEARVANALAKAAGKSSNESSVAP